MRHGGTRLDIRLMRHGDVVAVLEDIISLGKAVLDIAPLHAATRRDIALSPQVRQRWIRFPALVDHGRAVRSFLGINQGR